MTLKYPKKSTATQKRKEKLSTSTSPLPMTTQYSSSSSSSSSWMSPPTQHYATQQQPQHHYHHHEYTPQFTVDQSQYSPAAAQEAYYPFQPTHVNHKSPLLAQQLSPPLATATDNHHLMESCEWSAPTNHETAKPVLPGAITTNTYAPEQQQQTQWTTEFTYIDAEQSVSSPPVMVGKGEQQCPTAAVELMPEFINFCEYDQQTGFPPSVISSTASTLSSPTTSTDYNFTYSLDTPLNSSMSNDGFTEAMYQQQPQQMMDGAVYGGYETGMYGSEAVYQSPNETATHWTADISNIPYEPNYYPFANCTEKMMMAY